MSVRSWHTREGERGPFALRISSSFFANTIELSHQPVIVLLELDTIQQILMSLDNALKMQTFGSGRSLSGLKNFGHRNIQ